MMKNRTSSFFDFKVFKEIINKNPVMFAIAAIVVMFLLFSGSIFGNSKKSNTTQTETKIDIKKYTSETELKLKQMLEKVDGVGNCDVMLTVETGIEYVYATEQTIDNNTVKNIDSNYEKNEAKTNEKEKLIIVNDGNGGEKALIKKEIQPKIQGVAIICDGGSSAIVKSRVIDAVTTLLNITSDKVCVTVKR